MKIFSIFLTLAAVICTNLLAKSPFNYGSEIYTKPTEQDGYTYNLGVNLPVSFTHNTSQLGIIDGSYFKLAGMLNTGLIYSKEKHTWTTNFIIKESLNMTPSIKDKWIWAEDSLTLDTRYNYSFTQYFGAFAKASLKTSLFKGSEIHAQEQKYQVLGINGEVVSEQTTKSLKLRDPFLPLFLEQNLGLFSAPVREHYFTFEGHGAISFRQTFASRQRVFSEEKDDVRIIKTLQNFYQIGPTVGASIFGFPFHDYLAYGAGIDVMHPTWSNPKNSDRKFADSLIIDAWTKAGIALNSWATLEYQFHANKNPDILEKFQLNHTLNLNISFNWTRSWQ